jgi:hypothetical protein
MLTREHVQKVSDFSEVTIAEESYSEREEEHSDQGHEWAVNSVEQTLLVMLDGFPGPQIVPKNSWICLLPALAGLDILGLSG